LQRFADFVPTEAVNAFDDEDGTPQDPANADGFKELTEGTDLIGGCEGLIPANPPKEAIEARRKQANAATRSDYMHSVANPARGETVGERPSPPLVSGTGYRPGRKSQARRKKPGRGPKPK
jgi:hypothetical protein